MHQLSAYLLTHNSEKYLERILSQLALVADDLIVLDSGSTDQTEEIVKQFDQCRFIHQPFENFKSQRIIAEQNCRNDYILFVDSDEIPSQQLIDELIKLKKDGFEHDAYRIKRNWKVLGKEVHCIYPIVSPDYPIRLYRKTQVSFEQSNAVHESLSGYRNCRVLRGSLQHVTFHSMDELNKKLEFYTDIAAKDLLKRGKNISWTKLIFSPIAAFFKWYFMKGGYKDGWTGMLLGGYAFRYSLKKYQKARKIKF